MVQKQQKGENELVNKKLSEPDGGKDEIVDSKEKYEISSLVKSVKMKSNQVVKSKKVEKLQQRDTLDTGKPELSSLTKSVKKKAKVVKKMK